MDLPKINLKSATAIINGFQVRVADFALAPGVTYLSGLNGSGKTTFGRIILGLCPIHAGVRRVLPNLRLGYLPQAYREVFNPLVSGLKNLTLLGKNQSIDEAIQLLNTLNVTALDLEKRPSQLSGGQLQKIALAREITFRPDVLVLDEPFSSLDAKSLPIVERELCKLADNGTSVILISHLEGSSEICSRIRSHFRVIRNTQEESCVTEVSLQSVL